MTICVGSGPVTEATCLMGVGEPYTSTRSESTRPGLARPVRMPARSCLSLASAFSMRSSVSRRMSSALITVRFPEQAALAERRFRLFGDRNLAADERADSRPAHRSLDVALFLVIKNQDRHVVFHALRDRRGIHDAQILFAHRVIAQLAIQQGMRIFFRVVAVNPIH